MDVRQLQEMFRNTDAGDGGRPRTYLHPYFDIMKLRDGKIVEYDIAYDI